MVFTGPVGGLCRGSTPAHGRHARPHDLGVFRRLVRYQIRRHGKGKGTWRWDFKCGGTWTWPPLPAEPMSPVREAISVGSLSSLNLCCDPRCLKFGTAHFLVASHIGSHWDGAGSGNKERGSTSWSNGRRCWLERGRYIAPPSSTNTRARGAGTRASPTAFASWAVTASAVPLPPAAAYVIGDPVEAPTASTLFWTALGAVQAQGACTGFEVCFFAC